MTLLTLLLGSGHFGANIACFNLFTLPLPCWLHYFCPAQKMPCPANILLHPTEKYLVYSIQLGFQEHHCFYIHSLLDESAKLFKSTF